MASDYKELISYRSFIKRAESRWPEFLSQRAEKLAQQERFGKAPEKTSENIVGSLPTAFVSLQWGSSRYSQLLGAAAGNEAADLFPS